uniref:Putative transcription elongation factor SPT5 homolog 1 n=1 Tax=Rhizophora mucronata TaxID=61149 RepID=A0A2P2MJ83_RHIMU
MTAKLLRTQCYFVNKAKKIETQRTYNRGHNINTTTSSRCHWLSTRSAREAGCGTWCHGLPTRC